MSDDSQLDSASLANLIRTIRLVAFDFDGVFTDNMVFVFEDGREAVRCTRSDGIGLSKLKTLGLEVVIVSTETNPVVTARSRKLEINCVQSCSDKRAALEALASEKNISLKQIAFVGNDLNDLPCLSAVGLPIVVKDAHPDVIRYASYQTKTPGGYGAVREVCDLFDRILNTNQK
ncbi:MAG TPA: HAD hydrolase family protein [Pyrinomonadaceae bacterium]|nr:HAD hydrolase family protein [Pyrinomonadaceae bacterium]